jgi:transcriptional regulator with XRE-family HTH domain
MARKWREFRKQRSAEREGRIEKRISRESARINYSLAQLRTARNYTQAQLADVLDRPQNAVSKVEHRVDVYISTLRSYIEAMGGRLEIRAMFPDAEVVITQFEDIDPQKKQPEHHAVSA